MCLGLSPCFSWYLLLCLASVEKPLLKAKTEASSYLKYDAPERDWDLATMRDATFFLLPPISIISPFLLPISYAPGFCGIFPKLLGEIIVHFLRIGIVATSENAGEV